MMQPSARFHPTGKKFLETKFLPEKEAPKTQPARTGTKETSSREFSSILKRKTWEIVRKGGKIDTTDIVNIGPKTRQRFELAGFWSPSDFYMAYDKKYYDELASLARGIKGTVGTIADMILVAPETPPYLTKEDIVDKLGGRKRKKELFLNRRENEVKTYLEKIKINGRYPTHISFIDEGELLTHEKAKEISQPATPVRIPSAMIGNKIMRGNANLKRAAKNAVYKRGLRDAMTGINKSKIRRLSAFKKFFDSLASRHQKIAENRKQIEKNFIDGVMEAFKKNEVFIKDPDLGFVRPSDNEMAGYILSKKNSEALIGHTNNFEIASIAKPFPRSNLNAVDTGELVYQARSPTMNIPIRFTLYMTVQSDDDVEKLVRALGTNPKNGFTPRGYENTDDSVKKLMNTFSVFAMYHPNANMITPSVKNVRKNAEGYEIEVDPDGGLMEGITTHLWIKKEGLSDNILDIIKNQRMDEIARESFGKDYEDLTEEELSSLAISSEKFPGIWGMENEYGGSLCEIGAPSRSIRRLRATKSDVNALSNLAGRSKEMKDAIPVIKEKKDEIIEVIEGKTGRKGTLEELWEKEAGKIGTLNKRSVPNCLYIPEINGNTIAIKKGKGSKYIETKLNKAIVKCGSLQPDEKERCFVDTVRITQNFAEGLDSKVFDAIRKSKNQEDVKRKEETMNNLHSIERKLRTGMWDEERDDKGRIREIKPTRIEKREALNEAKLLGKMPLNIERWDFLDEL